MSAAAVPWAGLAAVAVGAVLGAWTRWGLATWLNPLVPHWPLGTLAANLAGGLAVGVAVAFFATRGGLAPEWRLVIVTGFLGALTTFSTFSAEVTTLLLDGRLFHALGLAAFHLFGSLALTAAGIAICRGLLS